MILAGVGMTSVSHGQQAAARCTNPTFAVNHPRKCPPPPISARPTVAPVAVWTTHQNGKISGSACRNHHWNVVPLVLAGVLTEIVGDDAFGASWAVGMPVDEPSWDYTAVGGFALTNLASQPATVELNLYYGQGCWPWTDLNYSGCLVQPMGERTIPAGQTIDVPFAVIAIEQAPSAVSGVYITASGTEDLACTSGYASTESSDTRAPYNPQ